MRRPAARAALLLPAVLAAAGTGPGAPAAGSAAPARLLVTATEFRLGLSRTRLPAGPALVQLADRGQDPHDLVVSRLDGHGRRTGTRRGTPEVPSGGTSQLRLVLRPGRYELFCSLPGHRAAGMRARLTVRP